MSTKHSFKSNRIRKYLHRTTMNYNKSTTVCDEFRTFIKTNYIFIAVRILLHPRDYLVYGSHPPTLRIRFFRDRMKRKACACSKYVAGSVVLDFRERVVHESRRYFLSVSRNNFHRPHHSMGHVSLCCCCRCTYCVEIFPLLVLVEWQSFSFLMVRGMRQREECAAVTGNGHGEVIVEPVSLEKPHLMEMHVRYLRLRKDPPPSRTCIYSLIIN